MLAKKISTWPKVIVKRVVGSLGYQITRRTPQDVAHSAKRPPVNVFLDDGTFPKVEVEKLPETWQARSMRFRVTEASGAVHEEDIFYSHATLFTFLKGDFSTVLDIGSGTGNVSRLLSKLGKDVTLCERQSHLEFKEYLESSFPRKFDAIWCSQVLEHQRNIGIFLNKIFDDLADGGVLAMAVPQQVDKNLCFGHCNMFTPLIMIYHLILAGFDCREIRLVTHENDISILLRKRYNGIDRNKPMASLPIIGDRIPHGDELFRQMTDCFPPTIKMDSVLTPDGVEDIPWGYPPAQR